MTVRKQLTTYGATVVIAVTLALLTRAWVVEPYRIPSEAMFPALEAGDTVLVNKLSYTSILGNPPTPPSVGDIVVFESPRDRGKEYIKRVVATEGQKVKLTQGFLSIDDEKRTTISANPSKTLNKGDDRICGDESLDTNASVRSYRVCLEAPVLHSKEEWTVPAGHLFVLGDFRSESLPGSNVLIDASGVSLGPRGWGIIPVSSVIGKAERVWLSVKPKTPEDRSFKRLRWDRFFKAL